MKPFPSPLYIPMHKHSLDFFSASPHTLTQLALLSPTIAKSYYFFFYCVQNKFSDANVERYFSFAYSIVQIDPTRLVYVDEAHFVSRKLHRQKAVGPIGSKTFVVRNSSILGDDDLSLTIATSLTSPSPVWGATTVGSNDGWNFYQFIIQLILSGFLCSGKVLILDNAPIHRSSTYLPLLMELFDELNVVVQFQPTYSPEFNAWSDFLFLFLYFLVVFIFSNLFENQPPVPPPTLPSKKKNAVSLVSAI